MNGTHPPPEVLDRFRRRAASPRELVEVDAHIAACDVCFAAVRADATAIALPGGHLTYDELVSFVDGGAGDPAGDPDRQVVAEYDHEVVRAHVAACAMCREELRDLEKARDAMQAVPLRAPRRRFPRLAAAAALLVLALAAAWLLSRDREAPRVVWTETVAPPVTTNTATTHTATSTATSTSPGTTITSAPMEPSALVLLERPAILDTLTGTEGVLRSEKEQPPFALHAPAGTVVLDERPQFRWEAVQGATSYDVAIVDSKNGRVAASGSSRSTAWRAVAALPRGHTFSWQVTARRPAGDVVAPGPAAPEALFRVASREEAAAVAAETDPLARGIALAQRGMLDDAEHELERAGAAELAARIRSWR